MALLPRSDFVVYLDHAVQYVAKQTELGVVSKGSLTGLQVCPFNNMFKNVTLRWWLFQIAVKAHATNVN